MDVYMVAMVLLGLAIVGASWIPHLVHRRPLSLPIVYVAVGYLAFELPLGIYLPNPLENGFFTERFAEILVIISLTGAGLKLSRPLGMRSWGPTWRLLLIGMPLCILLAALLGWGWIGLAPASALLLGAVLAPTDPVLASDVQVGSPGEGKEDDVRFALTSEAGLNDGLAFPFVHLAIAAAAASTGSLAWLGEWALWDVLVRIGVGILTGLAVGWGMAKVFFHLAASAPIARSRDGFVVVAITFLAYGTAELLHGYGFLAVFLAALTVRQAKTTHAYHQDLHAFEEGIERLLMTLMLILFGGLLAEGLLGGVTWTMVGAALGIVLVVRPLTAFASLAGASLSRAERLAVSFFGIRGIGSLYYLAYALNHQDFEGAGAIWRTVAVTILVSLALHGSTATYAMAYLDRHAERRAARAAAAED